VEIQGLLELIVTEIQSENTTQTCSQAELITYSVQLEGPGRAVRQVPSHHARWYLPRNLAASDSLRHIPPGNAGHGACPFVSRGPLHRLTPGTLPSSYAPPYRRPVFSPAHSLARTHWLLTTSLAFSNTQSKFCSPELH
jgi:hypothetical protein